jgi:hypothetical protein
LIQENKLNWKFFINLFKEAIGFDSGYIRTTIDLLIKPNLVLEKYKAGNHTYVNPVRYLLSSCTYFILINSFFVDWEKIGNRHTKELMEFTGNNGSSADFSNFVDFGQLLFSTLFVPITLLTAIVKLIYIDRTTKKLGLPISDHINIVFFSAGLSTLYTLWFSILLITLHIVPLIIVISSFTILFFVGLRKIFEPKSVDAFLPDHGKVFVKPYKNGDLISIFVVLIFIIIIKLFFEF